MRKTNRVLLTLAAVLASRVGAVELNALKDLQVVPTAHGAQVVVTGSQAPTFTVFRLSDPDRLVVDVSSADASGVQGHHDGTGPIAGIVASQFSDERASVGRILVSLEGASQYDVHADGTRVVISVDGTAATTTPTPPATEPESAAAEPAAPKPAVEEKAEPKEPQVAEAEPPPAPASPAESAKEEAAASPTPSPAENVISTHVDERPVAHPATHLTRLAFKRNTLQVGADGEVAKFEVIQLADPPRLAVDVYGVKLAAKAPKIHSPLLKEIRAGAHSDKVRLVLDLSDSAGEFHTARTADGFKVMVAPAVVAAKPAVAPPVKEGGPVLKDGEIEIDGQKMASQQAETAPLTPAPAPEAKHPALAEVKDLTFDDAPSGGEVRIKLNGEATWKVEHPDPRTAVLTVAATLPKRLERSLDTSALDTPVKMVSAFSVPGGDAVRVVVAANGALEERVSKVSGGLAWHLSAKGVKTEEVAVREKTAGFSAEAPVFAAQGAPQRARYVGKKVSFEFKDIDIHNLLRVIAEVSKKNIVVADDVRGTVTIRLRNVPWDEALDLILRSKGLGKEDLGNVIRVAPLATLEAEAKLRADRKKSETASEPLVVQLVPVNYAPAGDMSARVKEVLSERGNVTVDSRTNVLIIRDIASNIARARSLVQSLDLQTPQVLIESRIVEANVTFSKQIGVQWGGSASASPATGNPTGLVFPSSGVAFGSVPGAIPVGTVPANVQTASGSPNFAVNLPAAVGQGSGGALGMIFGSAGGALALNLRLSAFENQGTVKTISAPKITTLDNVPAKISQGVSIPFSQVSASGVNTTFIEARLSLEVTPHITQDGTVLMQINAQNNQPDPSNTGANGQPAIQRKEASTQVLVKDGDTTVIGGIYVRRAANSLNEVPLLGKIPILGFFFRNVSDSDARQELLIFITPRIINRQTIAQTL